MIDRVGNVVVFQYFQLMCETLDTTLRHPPIQSLVVSQVICLQIQALDLQTNSQAEMHIRAYLGHWTQANHPL